MTAAIVAFWIGLTPAAHADRLTESPLVDSAWLAQHLDRDALVVIDVRDPVDGVSAYDAGHVPGAISAPYVGFGWRAEVEGIPGMLPPVGAIADKIAQLGVDGNSQVVILSDGVNSTEFGKATRVYWTFKVLGHEAVAILDGGFRAWTAAGQPVSTDARTPTPAGFTADLQPDLLATIDEVRAALDQQVNLLDGRPESQYRGQDKSPVARVPGTLPGAVNIPHSQVYDGTRFVDRETMRRMADAAGVIEGRPTIAFCNTGHWASIAWFALSEVGGFKDVAMFDGSMAEWTSDPANPVLVMN
jgi:thiosulfate/3-mercaptopyruvate sulfurtransferase